MRLKSQSCDKGINVMYELVTAIINRLLTNINNLLVQSEYLSLKYAHKIFKNTLIIIINNNITAFRMQIML